MLTYHNQKYQKLYQQSLMKLSKIWVNGNELAVKLINKVKQSIIVEKKQRLNFYEKHRQWSQPQLHIVNVGFDDASLSYIKKKIDLASSIGIRFQLHQFIEKQQHSIQLHRNFEKIRKSSKQEDIHLYHCETKSPQQSSQGIIRLIKDLNNRKQVSGILMQLPLHVQLKPHTNRIIQTINPTKDVDCLTLLNRARIIEHVTPELMPCTPYGVLKIFDEYGINVSGKSMVIAGRSALVGLPLFHLMLNRNATISLCHHYTQNLNELTKEADIVISAIGKPNLITQLKQGCIAIDIGISRDSGGKLCGDILASAKSECYLATPVPGGVGPLTVAMLMQNTVKLWKKQMEQQSKKLESDVLI